jgi:hypothetical protein
VMEVVPPVVGANVPVPVGIFADIRNIRSISGVWSVNRYETYVAFGWPSFTNEKEFFGFY